ncbi:Hypothetical protein R9X50_00341300 [Acrodontium crateriforme]|uniref:Endoplasmic reticulum-based factor for assembly of V-ATPase-domain-containing protein n=1 Tax=Acrodontium crateriforme TaxID=150365 RepID=A0AAQ3RBU2_9PEZI|nr:Hypothetical protein R9X50_00341300 [Acrodontium crateriforme]
MVLLTITPAARAALEAFVQASRGNSDCNEEGSVQDILTLSLDENQIGRPIEHHILVKVSQHLVKKYQDALDQNDVKPWRLDTLLKGATVYKAPPPPKPETTPEFKALMQRLRVQEEQRQYERMINPPAIPETFGQRFPSFNPSLSHGQSAVDEADDVTYADVNRQMILIINVLVSIIACSVTIWIAARHWPVPFRLALSMSGSGVVAVAEVAIYLGYIKRIKDAKDKEVKKVEKKQILETWVIDKSSSSGHQSSLNDGARYRKGKHR